VEKERAKGGGMHLLGQRGAEEGITEKGGGSGKTYRGGVRGVLDPETRRAKSTYNTWDNRLAGKKRGGTLKRIRTKRGLKKLSLV